jgi:hypothetical protein
VIGASIFVGVVFVVLLLALVGYRNAPILSEDWRIVIGGNPERWRHNEKNSVVVWLVRRFRFAQLQYDTIGNQHRMRVGDVALDDPDFDEHLVELRYKADDLRRRLRAVA